MDKTQSIFKPILFSTPMVQAIIRGEKTQTRRLVKYKKQIENPQVGWTAFTPDGHFSVRGIHEIGDYGESFFKQKYQKGDILWVRETFRKANGMPTGYRYDWRATAEEDGAPTDEPWKPSIFMPKDACRIFLKITSIKVERLNMISEADAIAEGIEKVRQLGKSFYKLYSGNKKFDYDESPIVSYWSLWDKINGEGSYLKNPLVWVYKFQEIDKPEGFIV